MKALEISLIILKVMGFDNSFKNYPLKLIYSVQYTIQTIFLLFVILPSFAYTYSHLQNVTQATDAAYVLFCYAYTLCTLWSFVMVKEKVINTVSDLGELVERRMQLRKQSNKIYTDAIRKGNRIAKRFAIYLIIMPMSVFAFYGCVIPLINIIRGQNHSAKWSRVYRLKFFFDQTTLVGFYLEILLTTLGGCAYIPVMLFLTGGFAEICIYVQAMFADLVSVFDEIDGDIVDSNKRDISIKSRIVEVIELHMTAKRISENAADSMSGALFFQILNGIVMLPVALFQADLAITNSDLSILRSVNAVVMQLIVIYILCSHATDVSMRFVQYKTDIYNSLWYFYPIEYRNPLIIMMSNSQQPFQFTGLKIIHCTLETYTKIINTSISYYLLFRRISEAQNV